MERAKRFLATGALAALVLTAAAIPGGAALAQRPSLWWGKSGSDVVLVQSTLRDWGYYRGAVDGFYGNSTVSAVARFQRDAGLTPDGVVGPATWEALGFPAATPVARWGAGPAVARVDDIDLLARVVTGEAGEEPFEGQVAVAAVILNRIRDPRFPKSLAGVIYEPWAFESVANGFIWARPPKDSAYKAAIAAMNGWDPTYGAVYFWNPATATSPWVWTRNIIVAIGRHIFAR